MELYIPIWLLWLVGVWFAGAMLNLAVWLTFEISMRELKRHWGEAIATILFLWPYSIVCLPLVKLRRRREENKRQQRITEGVNNGEISVEFARNNLKWRG